MVILITFLNNIIMSPYFLLAALAVSITTKIFYVARFFSKIWKKNVVIKPLLFLLVSIISSLICDFTWLIKLIQAMFIPMPYFVVVFFIRIAWAFLVIQYLSLSLFLQALTKPLFQFGKTHTIATLITGGFSSYFLILAFFRPFTLSTIIERDTATVEMIDLEFIIMKYFIPVLIYTLAFLGLFIALKNMQHLNIPKLLRRQIKLFCCFFIIPYLCIEFILATCFTLINEMHFMVSISMLMLTSAIYYCLHNVMKIRFLNTSSRVHGIQKAHVIDNFKTVLKELSDTQNTQELIHITQAFFKDAFYIPTSTIRLTIRDQYFQEQKSQSSKDDYIEDFIGKNNSLFYSKTVPPVSIMVFDEIALNNFYESSPIGDACLDLLRSLTIDILLPIYSNKILLGYITIDQKARNEYHYNNSEQDAMIAYATYLGNVINLLHHRNANVLLYKEKKLKDSLYTKHQEINHYKESVHTFLRQAKQKTLGILFHKNGHFSRANKEAGTLISIDPNIQEGHPLSKALKQVAQYVETFNTPYTKYVKDGYGHLLLLSGVPHIKNQQTIITVSHPDISDVIMEQIHLLHDPNDWDYLLYLSSTKAGNLINTFIPGEGEVLLNAKIALLKAALSKRTLLLNVPEDDLMPTVKLVHEISMRETLHTLNLTFPMSPQESAALLFGTSHADPYIPLLQKGKNGSIYIKNIHYLDIAIQPLLIEYITYGWYHLYESNETVESNARIICSTHQQLSNLIEQGKFSRELYSLLKKHTISIPSLVTLPPEEKESLIVGLAEQLIHSYTAKSLFALTEKEKQKIIEYQPASLTELRLKIEHVLLKKADTSGMETDLNLINYFEDPNLVYAARLGKQALKDEHILAMLWKKFKSQNKIALFLGVNRSSVNRRFKSFDIGDNSEGIA